MICKLITTSRPRANYFEIDSKLDSNEKEVISTEKIAIFKTSNWNLLENKLEKK